MNAAKPPLPLLYHAHSSRLTVSRSLVPSDCLSVLSVRCRQNVLLQTIRMALSDELDESAQPLVDVLLALLPVESHSQVLENDAVHVSFAKSDQRSCRRRAERSAATRAYKNGC